MLAWLFWVNMSSESRREDSSPLLSGKFAPLVVLLAAGGAYLFSPPVDLPRLVFFVGESAVMGGASAIIFCTSNSRMWRTAIIAVVCVNVLNGLGTKLALGGTVWGVDEQTYMLNALEIAKTGTFSSIQTGFYQLPTVPQLLYTISSITSLSIEVTTTLVSTIVMVLFQGIIFLFSSRFTKDLRVLFAIQVITIFTPRLVLVQQVIPEAFSLTLSALVLYFLARIVLRGPGSVRRDFVIAMTLYATVVFTHPSGVIPPLTFLLLATLAYSQRKAILDAGYKLDLLVGTSGYSLPKILLLLTGTAATAYWLSSGSITSVVLAQLSQYTGRITGFGSGGGHVSYVPLYTDAGLQYAIVWVVPVALASAYYLVRILTKRKDSWSKWETLGLFCFIGGIVLTVGAFFVLASSPTATTDRYLDSPSYFLLAISLALPLSKAFTVPRTRLLTVALLALLLSVIVVGPSIPDISPDSHAAIFEPPNSASVQFFGSLVFSMVNGSTIAAEKNFVIPVTTQALAATNDTLPFSVSYKTTRDALGAISAGTESISAYPADYFVVDTALLPGFVQNSENASNIYASTGEFILLQALGTPKAPLG